jgi:phospholipid/cholesterol/gamma-HCH transport system substrate-binding protein
MGTPPKSCLAQLAPLTKAAKSLNFSLDLSWLTALTTTYSPICPPADAYGPGYKGPKATGCVNDPKALKPAGVSALLPGGTP